MARVKDGKITKAKHKKILKQDEFYMKRAIELAKNGTGWVNPNPLVGAIIVKDDRSFCQLYKDEGEVKISNM